METKRSQRLEDVFQGTASRLAATDPEWVGIAAAFSQREVPAASRLTERERMLCILSALLGCQGMGEYRHMLCAALNGGLDPVAVKETVYQATAYLGISLLIAPAADGDSNTATVFARSPLLAASRPVEFRLKSANRIGADGMHLLYTVLHSERRQVPI